MTSATLPAARLTGVDGLRAFAAMWVVLFHAHVVAGSPLAQAPLLGLFLRSGSTGVSLFLVISGFVLFLPFAGGRAGRFDTKRFFIRRAKRLLPAYYVAVLFAVALSAWGGSVYEQFSIRDLLGQIANHLLLLQTFTPETFYRLNGAFWSLGLEWQLYLALPLLIFGIRRFGLTRTLGAAIICNVVYRLVLAGLEQGSLLPQNDLVRTAVLPNQLPGRWAEFAFGMAVAELYARGGVRLWARHVRWLIPFGVVAGVAAVGNPLSHLVFGVFFSLLLMAVLASDNVVARVFNWKPLVSLGIMSYSLYLVHQPILQGLAAAIRTTGASPISTFVALIALLPVVILSARVLFIAVERRTLMANPPVAVGRPTATTSPSQVWPGEPVAGARPPA